MAIRWGIVESNPCQFVKRLPESPRDKYITDQELEAIKQLANENIRYLIEFAYLTGLRQADILKVRLSDLLPEGIYVEINKNKVGKIGKKVIFEWTEGFEKYC